MFRALVLAASLLAASCDTIATRAPPPRTSEKPSDDKALFPADSQVLPDADIARIMDARWQVPAHVRIALLPLRRDSVFASIYYYVNPSGSLGPQTAFQAVDELRKLPFVYDVSYLPEFLMPANKSIALVREAAARYQADWVLVYATSVAAHPKYHMFIRDEAHGMCTVDCALLDTRTGLIPFTARSTEEIHAKQQSSDEEMPVMLLRAEQQAVDAAMLSNAKALVAFLGKVDKK